MKYRVALDVTPELFASTGVARYSRELRRALQRRDDCDVTEFAIGRASETVPPGARHVAVPLRAVHAAWGALGIPRAEQLTGPVDIVHSLDLVAPPSRRPVVVTIHDLVAVELPDLHPKRARRLLERRLSALDRAAAIITVSESTAAALAARGIERARIHVTLNGRSPLAEPVTPPVPPGPFILTVGTLEPRKGHELLLEAFARAGADGVRLVFAGPVAGRLAEVRSAAARLGIEDRLVVLGRVDDSTLAGLYRDATLLAMPSLAEGFGLPVLEAMSAGLPVVASALPATKEVAGEAATLVPPGDVDALRRAIEKMLADESLRAQLSRAGRQRAASFTWEETAAATVRVYEVALAASR
jgi:glycosyltransferase involved in cell wall biosynthesis